MSHLDNILSALGIKGIFPDPDHPEEILGQYKGVRCFLMHVIQRSAYAPCPSCQGRGIRYGYKQSYVKMPRSMDIPYWLVVKKQRYQCCDCRRTYLSDTNLTDPCCFISNPVKHLLVQDAKNKISVSDISKRHQVSWTTTQREINKWSQLTDRTFDYLPEIICIDEFRAVSTLKNSKMALSLVDGTTHKILDICPDRKLSFLTKHFGQYNDKVRSNVKYFCTDMYEPFLGLARKMFPTALICIDKFHVVQLASHALNTCRIEVMKQIQEKVCYKTFKQFWRIPLTFSHRLDSFKTVWVSYLQSYKTNEYLLDLMLSQNEVFRETYEIYQSLLRAFAMNDAAIFEDILKADQSRLHHQMRTTLATFRRLKRYIINGIETGHTNGPMEANNNNIKVLKRIAYGYRNYNNFRNRILLVYTNTLKFAA